MALERNPWQELKPGIEMPLAVVLLGSPDDSFQTDSDFIVWTFRAGGWIRFKADRVVADDTALPSPESTLNPDLGGIRILA